MVRRTYSARATQARNRWSARTNLYALIGSRNRSEFALSVAKLDERFSVGYGARRCSGTCCKCSVDGQHRGIQTFLCTSGDELFRPWTAIFAINTRLGIYAGGRNLLMVMSANGRALVVRKATEEALLVPSSASFPIPQVPAG